jgi:hypothetical protein
MVFTESFAAGMAREASTPDHLRNRVSKRSTSDWVLLSELADFAVVSATDDFELKLRIQQPRQNFAKHALTVCEQQTYCHGFHQAQ